MVMRDIEMVVGNVHDKIDYVGNMFARKTIGLEFVEPSFISIVIIEDDTTQERGKGSSNIKKQNGARGRVGFEKIIK